MNSITRLIPVVAGLVLILNTTPSWGGPPNPTESDGNFNTAGGTNALVNVDETASGGFLNTAFGVNALVSNTTGSFNTASGADALVNNTIGSFNTAVGDQALEHNTIGAGNTATGTFALNTNVTGSRNTASGAFALRYNTSGNDNIASGHLALDSNDGNKNTAVGTQALFYSVGGNKNIALGFKAGFTLVNGNNNIYIGNAGNGDESQTIRVGAAQTRTFIAGIATASVSGATVEIDTATGQLGITPSSARYKRDIAPMGTRSEGVLQLRPVTFAYQNDAQGMTHYGLIAEEVAAVYPELVTHTATGEVQTVRYQELIPMLLNELQRQRQEFQLALQSQEQALQSQQQALRRQQQELADLRALVGQPLGMVSLSR